MKVFRFFKFLKALKAVRLTRLLGRKPYEVLYNFYLFLRAAASSGHRGPCQR